MSGLMMAGDLYLDRLDDNGDSTGEVGPLNGIKLAINPSASEKKTRISRQRDTRGQALDTVEVAQPQTITISVDDQPSEVLAMAFRAIIEAISEGAAVALAETVTMTAAKVDRWVKLTKRSLTALVVKDVTDTTTYTVDTDYEINLRTGQFRVLSTGSIGATDVLHLTIDSDAVTGQRIRGAAEPTIRAAVRLDGQNLVNNKNVEFYAKRVTLTPEGETDLLTEEFVVTSLTGTLETPTGEDEPYTLDELD